MASWAHDAMGLNELVQAASVFLDILALASGYQSSGKTVLWQPGGVARALRWAAFLEQAMRGFPTTDQGRSSIEVLDMALADLMDVTPHPPGLPQLTCEVLCSARDVLVSFLVQAFGIGNGQIVSVVLAAPDCSDLAEVVRGSSGDEKGGGVRSRKRSFDEFRIAEVVSEEISSRERAKSALDAIGQGLECVIRDLSSRKVPDAEAFPIWKEDESSSDGGERCLCEKWCEEAIAYWTSAKTIYKLTGATTIFDAGKELWSSVLDSLHRKPAMGTPQGDDVVEVAELCLLYLASADWNYVLHKLMSSIVPSSSCSSAAGAPDRDRSGEVSSPRDLKLEGVEQYFLGLLRSRRAIWWKLPAILAAAVASQSSGLSAHYVESIAVHVHSKQSSGICFCHACCSRAQCDQCRHLVHERLWCVLLLKRMQSDCIEQLKRLYIRSCDNSPLT